MQLTTQCWLASLIVASLWLAGCQSGPSWRHPSHRTPLPSTGAEAQAARAREAEFSAKAVEQRTEAQTRYALGWLHLLHDEVEEGLKEYQQAALLDPGNDELVLEVASRLLQRKKHDEVLEVLVKATQQPGASARLFAHLAMVYSALDRKEAAIEASQTAIQRNPRLLLGYQLLAQIYARSDQREEALKTLDDAARQPDASAGFLVDLADLYVLYGRAATDARVKAKALDLLKRAEKLDTANPDLLTRLADSFAALGDQERSTAAYARLLERYPQNIELRKKLAELYIRRLDFTNAALQLQALIKENPTDPQPYFVLGNLALEQKKPKEAIEHFTKTLLLNAAFQPAYYDLAGAQISANQPYNALDTLKKARAKFDKTFQTEFYAALAFSRLKEYSNAVNSLTAAEVIGRATATNRLNHFFYFQLGAAYERNQQFEAAEKTFRKVLAMSPDFSEALNYLGYMWAERGVNLSEARAMIEKAVKQEPTNAAFLDSLGWVLFRLGQPEEALTWLRKALEHSEEPDATLFDHLGDIYQTLKQPEKAREAWQKALSIEPTEAVRQKLGAATVSGGGPR